MTRVALYTSGFIGGGHLALAESIKRALTRAGSKIEFRVFYAEMPVDIPEGTTCEVVRLATDPKELRNQLAAEQSQTAVALREYNPDLLLVDSAFRDLRYIRPLVDCEAWLLFHWIPRHLFHGPYNRTFDPSQYSKVIGTEPGLPFDVDVQLEPVVICNREECHPPFALRDRLHVPTGRQLSLVAHTGRASEMSELEDEERRTHPENFVARATMHDARPIFPLAHWLPGADRIVGGAGYGLFWEVKWLGLAAKAQLRPFPRGIDDQTPRMRNALRYEMRQNGADQLARMLESG